VLHYEGQRAIDDLPVIQGSFVQPFRHPPRCPNSSSSHWIGLGGDGDGLIQAGTVIDQNGNLFAFYNYLQPQYEVGDFRLPGSK
jgi:hypothetical protein